MTRPYYAEGGVSILHGDARELLVEVAADVVITDPPYALGIEYGSYIDTRDNLVALLAAIGPLWDRFARRYVLCGPTQVALYPEPAWIAVATWNTTGTFGGYGFNQWTPILCYGPDANGRADGRIRGDVLRLSGGAELFSPWTEHPCPKPLSTMRLVVDRFTRPEDVIVDPFMGIGSTLVAAKRLGRRAIGIELEERYCETAARRLAQRMLPFDEEDVDAPRATPVLDETPLRLMLGDER